MAEAHVDHPGEMRWFHGQRAYPVVGPCPHDCKHLGTGVIAWGPSEERYELIECGIKPGDPGHDDSDCQGRCRAWTNGRGQVVTPWLMVEL